MVTTRQMLGLAPCPRNLGLMPRRPSTKARPRTRSSGLEQDKIVLNASHSDRCSTQNASLWKLYTNSEQLLVEHDPLIGRPYVMSAQK